MNVTSAAGSICTNGTVSVVFKVQQDMREILVIKPGCVAVPGKRSDQVIGLGQQIPADLSGEQRVIFEHRDAVLNGVGRAALLCFGERLQDPTSVLFQFGI